MTTILLLEDDEAIAFAITRYLEQYGYKIIYCDTITKARSSFTLGISLVLLDLNLPDGCGYDFCRHVKHIGDIPVIFLTVRDDEVDMVQGLDMGADDYIVKPFQLSVLKSRINAVLRRSIHTEKEETVFCCEEIRTDTTCCRVFVKTKEVFLTAGEYRLLLILLQNKNRTMTRNSLLEQLWDINSDFVNDNTLTVTMKRLREKLDNPSCIRTLRGLGYRMEDSL